MEYFMSCDIEIDDYLDCLACCENHAPEVSDPAKKPSIPNVEEIRDLSKALKDIRKEKTTSIFSPLSSSLKNRVSLEEDNTLPSFKDLTKLPEAPKEKPSILDPKAPSNNKEKSSILDPTSKIKEPHASREMMGTYIGFEKLTNERGQIRIKNAEGYLSDLQSLQKLRGEIEKVLDNPPDEYAFTDPSLKESLQVAVKHGLISKDQKVFSKKELKILYAKINATNKILPDKANYEFQKASRYLDMLLQVSKILQNILERESQWVSSMNQKMGH